MGTSSTCWLQSQTRQRCRKLEVQNSVQVWGPFWINIKLFLKSRKAYAHTNSSDTSLHTITLFPIHFAFIARSSKLVPIVATVAPRLQALMFPHDSLNALFSIITFHLLLTFGTHFFSILLDCVFLQK